MAFLALQELPRRPVQPAAGVRADIEPGADRIAIAMEDEGFRIVADRGLNFGKTTVGDVPAVFA